VSRSVYLDAPASTPMDPLVADAMVEVLRHVHANPASAHFAGHRARGLVDDAREHVGALAHQGPTSVIFTSGATESNALALRGLLGAAGTRSEFVSCTTEHPAVLQALRVLGAEGHRVHLVGVDRDGRLNLDELAATVSDRTLLVSVMAANNETGVLADLPAVTRIAHYAGAYVHTDASQLLTWGALPLDHDVDLVTVSGHKMHGPQGVGALIVSREARRKLQPIQVGGGQEGGLRSGTTNVAGVVGLGRAAELAKQLGPNAAPQTCALRDLLFDQLCEALPVALLNGHRDHRLPGTLNVAIGTDGDEVDAHAVLASAPDVAASTGSACSAGTPQPSPVLLAMGLGADRAASSLRLGLSRMSDPRDVQDAVPVLVKAVLTVRQRTFDPQERLVRTA